MKYTFIYFALLFAAFSCKKKDSCSGKYNFMPDYSYIDPTLDSYKFKENTYWVYRNDITAQLDSQRVVSTENGYLDTYGGESAGGGSPGTCSPGYVTEQYKMQVKSFSTNEQFNYLLVGGALYKHSSGTPFYQLGRPILTYWGYQGSNLEFMETIPSMNINGNDFQNVQKIWVKHLTGTYVDNLSDHELYYYFDSAVGLVKWEVVDVSTILESWSIQSWEVIL